MPDKKLIKEGEMFENLIGIDPGKDGGLAARYQDGRIEVEPMIEGVIGLLDYFNEVSNFGKTPTFIFIEKAQAMHGNGVTSTFTYGTHWGELLAAVKFSKIPYELIPPAVWCKVMHAGCSGDRPKEKSKEVAARLFPDLSLVNPHSPRARTIHLGMLDATVILEFGRRKRDVLEL